MEYGLVQFSGFVRFWDSVWDVWRGAVAGVREVSITDAIISMWSMLEAGECVDGCSRQILDRGYRALETFVLCVVRGRHRILPILQ